MAVLMGIFLVKKAGVKATMPAGDSTPFGIIDSVRQAAV